MLGLGSLAQVLRRKPQIANFVTTGFLFGTGDVLAQLCFPENTLQKYDYPRTLRAVIYGSIIFSPIGFRWYKFLDSLKLNPYFNPNKWKNTIYRVAVDQLVWAPIGIPLYYTCMTIMEGNASWANISKKLQDNWWITLKTNWIFWPIFQLFNFYLIPLHLRLLSVNIVSIFWNCLLSYRNSLTS